MRHSKRHTSLTAMLILLSTSSLANDLSLSPTSLQLKLSSAENLPASPQTTSAPPASYTPEAHNAPQLVLEDDAIIPPINDKVDVWARIRDGFGIPDLDNNLVKAQLNWYSTRPDYVLRTSNRATRYLYYVVQELEKRSMPTELALLPFIESAFNPQAFSSASAAGMWQFIPSTGRDYNLKQTLFKDERRAVLASTDAALTYLQRLYTMFGDWQLALAAYNWGEGNVSRLVKRQQAAGKPTDYNSMSSQMPLETRNYVPKLQAVKNIIANPQAYNIALPKLENQPYFTTIGKTRDIDIKLAAQLAEMPMEEFKALNPQFNRPVIVGSAKTELLLPQENADKFKINLAQWGRALSSWTTHTITNTREKIETLAAKFSTTPDVIREANNIPPKMRLKAGSTILVPKTETSAESNIDAELADTAKLVIEPDVEFRKIMHKVGKRDNLHSIAARYKVSVADVKNWNGLQQDKLSNGQRLQIQVPVLARAATRNVRAPVQMHAKIKQPAKQLASAKHPPRQARPVLAHAKPHGRKRA